MNVIHRRRFVLAAGAFLVAPGVLSQQSADRVRRIGVLYPGTHASSATHHAALMEDLRERGFVEGRNLHIEYQFADFEYRKLERMAEALVRAKVELIYASTNFPAYAAQAATKTIPIVITGVSDPVQVNLVRSLARPGGNITGVQEATGELTAKRVELMRELFPGSKNLGVVYDEYSARACNIELKDIGAAGKQLGVEIRQFGYTGGASLEDAFGKARRSNISALLIPTTYETHRFGQELATQSSSSRIPLIHASSVPVEAGGLLSYGPAPSWSSRRAGYYIARILNGAKPSDLPVERPATYELVINLRTARATGIAISQSILLRADRVIE